MSEMDGERVNWKKWMDGWMDGWLEGRLVDNISIQREERLYYVFSSATRQRDREMKGRREAKEERFLTFHSSFS